MIGRNLDLTLNKISTIQKKVLYSNINLPTLNTLFAATRIYDIVNKKCL